PDDARQPLGSAVYQRDTPPALEETKGRSFRCDSKVAPQRKLDATRETPAGDRGDRGLGGRRSRESHGASGMVRFKRRERLQVRPGAKRDLTGSRENEDARSVVLLEPAETLPQQLGGLSVDGVSPLDTVDRHDGGAAGSLVTHGIGAHCAIFSCFALDSVGKLA